MKFYRTLFLAIMAFMVIISLVTYYSYQQLSDEYLVLSRNESINTDLKQLMFDLEHAETAYRGYLITGDKFYFESLTGIKSDISERLENLDKELAEEKRLVEMFTNLRGRTEVQVGQIDSIINLYREDGIFTDEQNQAMRSSEERLSEIKIFSDQILHELRAELSEDYSRTFTPLFIIIGFLVAIAAIIYLYSNLYRSLQSNLAAEMQLEKNLIELGHEIQEREEAEMLTDRILDSADSSIIHCRPVYKDGKVVDFKIIKCNHMTEKHSGLSKKDLVGMNLLEYFPGIRESGLFDDYVRTLETQQEYRRELLYDYDDIHLFLDIRVIPLDDGLVITSKDISERIRTQRRIEDNNRKFTSLFNQAFQFIALLNENNEITDINESFLNFLRVSSDTMEGKDLTDLSIWKGENEVLIEQLIEKARETGGARQELLITIDQEERYLDLSCTRVPGNETWIIFEARDLTELRWAEEENEFLAHLNVSITQAEDFNHAARLVFSKIGKRYELDSTEVWVPEGDDKVRLLTHYLFDPTKKSGYGERRHIYPRGNGVVNQLLSERKMIYIPDISSADSTMIQRKELLLREGYKSLFAIPIVFEGEVLLIANFLSSREIDEIEELKSTLQIMSSSIGALLIKKKVQDDLRRNNMILNEAEKLTRLGSWEWQLEDGSLQWSEGMYNIIEIENDRNLTLEEFRQFVHPEDVEELYDMLAEKVSQNDSYELDFRLLLPSGKVKYVKATGHPLFNDFGTVGSYTGTLQDITSLKNHELELHEMNEELLESNKNLEQFAYIASHDLQEPLRKIRAFGGRLEQKYSQVLDEKGVDYLSRMQNAAERMQTLINDLLKYSRVTRNIQPFSATNLNKVVDGVLSDLESAVTETGARVSVDTLPAVQGDHIQLRQLFQNLISNAIKFVPEGHVPEVRIWAENVNEKNLHWQNGNGECDFTCINVRDNGIGVDKKYKERIFGLFERLHGRRQYSGTGIGLAICQKVVQNHHGHITFESEKGKGTVFKVFLPVMEKEKSL